MSSGSSTACWLENCPLTNETQSLSLGNLYQLSPTSDILLRVKMNKVVYPFWLGELLTRSRTELFALVEVQNNYTRTHACVFVWIPMYGYFPCTRDRIQYDFFPEMQVDVVFEHSSQPPCFAALLLYIVFSTDLLCDALSMFRSETNTQMQIYKISELYWAALNGASWHLPFVRSLHRSSCFIFVHRFVKHSQV